MALKNFIQNIVPLSHDNATLIESYFESFTFKKGEIILKKGQISDDYIYLTNGLIRSYLYDLEGKEVTTDFFTAENMAFEVTSFFNRTPSDIYMEAVTECVGLKINYETLNYLFHHNPACREFGRAVLVREFTDSKKRNYAMINQTAEQRYQHLVAQKPFILKHAPLKQIASYLGMTDSTLSRIRAKL